MAFTPVHSPMPTPEVRVLNGGWVSDFRWPESWSQWVREPFWHLYWNPSGDAKLFHEGRELCFEPGRAVLIPPQMLFRRSCPTRMEQLYLHFTADARLGLADGPALLPVRGAFGHLLRQVVARLRTGQAVTLADGARIAALVHTALAEVELCELAAGAIPSRIAAALHAASQSRFQLDNRSLAKVACMHPHAFERAFRDALSSSPQAWLRQRRVESARQLLADPARTLAQVAELTGFHDHAHLSRAFTAQFGITPTAWRRKLSAG